MAVSVSPQAPFPAPEPLDLGQFFRGDTRAFTLTLTDEHGVPVDLTAADIWWTAKVDLALEDTEGSSFQLSTLSSGVAISGAPTGGAVKITIPSSATVNLIDDTLFFWDLQVKQGSVITTHEVGVVLVVRDVTRAVS